MFKNLPKLKTKILGVLLLLILVFNISLVLTPRVFADDPSTPTSETQTLPDGTWVKDNDVTFAGKVAARSGSFLDWAIANYKWSSVSGVSGNPIASFWSTIRNIIYAFLTLFVLVSAFVIIVTRGKNLTLMKFIPRFIMIILLITLSFAIIQFIYQIMDAIQGFFFTSPRGGVIQQQDLLFVGFPYTTFEGYRKFGSSFDESVFVSLLLVKLTALTYYVMVGVLLLRKIILWFFIIISPIFPLLLLYSPIRNTAKIWVGEFFRWLLYAPLFAIFLSGLVHLWSDSKTGIPLQFNFSKPEQYPTAISILLGGPGQIVSLTNSVNNPDTFALYVVALLMLWVVIILPFLLLQIFLDFLHDFSFSENTVLKQLVAGGSSLIGRGNGSSPPPPSAAPAGIAKPLPFIPAKISIPQIRSNEANITAQSANIAGVKMGSEVLRLANLSIPTMKDIAQYETALMSSSIGSHQDLARVHETLEGISNPAKVTSLGQRQRFGMINDRLKEEARKGDPLASSILSAAKAVEVKPASIDSASLSKVFAGMNNLGNVSSFEDKQKLNSIKTALTDAQQKGDPLANSIISAMQKGESGVDDDLKQRLLAAKEQGNQLAISLLQQAGFSDVKMTGEASFPVANRVQAVSIDDYESVKKIWQENYLKLEPPKSIEGKQRDRKDWISGDIEKISETINLLVSSQPQNVSKGMEEVGAILPFLLIGGFAQTEVIAYLKAKLEAAKTVVGEIDKQAENEDTMLGREAKKEDKPQEMEMKAEITDKQEDKKI